MSASAATRTSPLSGLHLLLTYECNYECDHCFVWGGPEQGSAMTDETIGHILNQAAELQTIEWIYFEGGEPFLDFQLLCSGVRLARERVHVDALGNLHICQGISIGNLLERPLTEIMRDYDPDTHPVVGPLLAGGPAELVNRYQLPHEQAYADACHLCYLSRCKLRDRFPDVLTPGQMYGIG